MAVNAVYSRFDRRRRNPDRPAESAILTAAAIHTARHRHNRQQADEIGRKDQSMGIYYHFTSYNHMKEIAESGKITLTCSNLLYPTNMRIENGTLVSDTDYYKPVVWLTNKDTATGLGVDPATHLPVDDDKRRIRITIESGALIVKKWLSWSYHNHMDVNWRNSLIKGQDYKTWYITETEIPVANITRIEDMYSGIDYSIEGGKLIENR